MRLRRDTPAPAATPAAPAALPYSAFSGPPPATAPSEEPATPSLVGKAKDLVASVRRFSLFNKKKEVTRSQVKVEAMPEEVRHKPRDPLESEPAAAFLLDTVATCAKKDSDETDSESDASEESEPEDSPPKTSFVHKEYNRRNSFASFDQSKRYESPTQPKLPGPPPPLLTPNLTPPSASATPSGSYRSTPQSSPNPSKQPANTKNNNRKSFASQSTAKKQQHRKSHVSAISANPSTPTFYPMPMMQPTNVIYVPVPMLPSPSFVAGPSHRSSLVLNIPIMRSSDSDTSEEDSIPLQVRHEDSIPLQWRLDGVNSSKRNSVVSFGPSLSLAASNSPRFVQDTSLEEEVLSSSGTESSGDEEVSAVAVSELPAIAAIRKRQSAVLLAQAAQLREEEQVAERKRREAEDARAAIRKKRESMMSAKSLAIPDKVTTQDLESVVVDTQKQDRRKSVAVVPTPWVLPTAGVDPHRSASFDSKPSKRFSLADLRHQQYLLAASSNQQPPLSSSPIPTTTHSKRFSTISQRETPIPASHSRSRPTSAYIAPHQVTPTPQVLYPTQPVAFANPALFAQQQQQQQQATPPVSAFDEHMKELKRASIGAAGPFIKFSKEEEQISLSLKMAMRAKLELEERAMQQEMLRARGEQRGEGYA
ncbi:hypothetical protein HDU98_002519 [Podochytrium sp. JEL0797]|nr:hypothetical protein HDU98_002519 [Podochytrium sp. JEL0797]